MFDRAAPLTYVSVSVRRTAVAPAWTTMTTLNGSAAVPVPVTPEKETGVHGVYVFAAEPHG